MAQKRSKDMDIIILELTHSLKKLRLDEEIPKSVKRKRLERVEEENEFNKINSNDSMDQITSIFPSRSILCFKKTKRNLSNECVYTNKTAISDLKKTSGELNQLLHSSQEGYSYMKNCIANAESETPKPVDSSSLPQEMYNDLYTFLNEFKY